MGFVKSATPKAWLWICAMLLAVAVGGCGESANDQLWDYALTIDDQQSAQLRYASQANDRQGMIQAHEIAAQALRYGLESYPTADARLRTVLEQMMEGESQLASGAVSGAEAEALRQRHEEYWGHLRDRRIPPDVN